MSKHTPGPWTVLPGITSGDIITPMGRVASCVVLTTDANLIAAAPDMLEALEAVEAWWNAHGIEGDHRTDAFCTLARNAIKKARGQT
jgi:hypothetical protein